MIPKTPKTQKTPNLLQKTRIVTLAALILAACLAASFSIIGCKSKPTQPAAVAGPQESNQTPPTTPAPIAKKHIYPDDTADPKADIAAALKQAAAENKRLILDFGGDWCGDCQVLDIYFHQAPNADIVDKNFIIVHVNIGHMDKHVDIAEKYGIPLTKGVPALAVIDAHDKLLYSQKTGEFENMRHMDADSVTGFLNRWKA